MCVYRMGVFVCVCVFVYRRGVFVCVYLFGSTCWFLSYLQFRFTPTFFLTFRFRLPLLIVYMGNPS